MSFVLDDVLKLDWFWDGGRSILPLIFCCFHGSIASINVSFLCIRYWSLWDVCFFECCDFVLQIWVENSTDLPCAWHGYAVYLDGAEWERESEMFTKKWGQITDLSLKKKGSRYVINNQIHIYIKITITWYPPLFWRLWPCVQKVFPGQRAWSAFLLGFGRLVGLCQTAPTRLPWRELAGRDGVG